MSTLSTQINPRSDVFQANEAAMQKEVSKLRELGVDGAKLLLQPIESAFVLLDLFAKRLFPI